jgi:predicted metal-dependent RNase
MRKLSPKSILCVHGERTKEFAHSIEKEFPEVSAYAPKNGDEINV